MSSGSRLSMTAVGTEMAAGEAAGTDVILGRSMTVRGVFCELVAV